MGKNVHCQFCSDVGTYFQTKQFSEICVNILNPLENLHREISEEISDLLDSYINDWILPGKIHPTMVNVIAL